MAKKVTFAMLAVMALALVCFAPMVDIDGDGQIYHDGTNVYEVSTTETFTIKYTLDEEVEKEDLSFTAKVVDRNNNTVTKAVSPSTGSLVNGVSTTVDVTVPSTAGNYKLVVAFSNGDDLLSTEEYPFTAVTPKTLTANLKATEVTLDLQSFGVYFYIDGERMDDSYTTITLNKDGTGSVSYDWIADPEPGLHTFQVVPASGLDVIEGIDEVHTFTVGVEDYSFIIAFVVIIMIVLIIWIIRTYRKPIRNFGKPKSRR